MSARVWTREELDRVHPLPDGWRWEQGTAARWHAIDDSEARCFIWQWGGIGTDGDVPADVALAVILASKGVGRGKVAP
jgi:hypothetical protein